MDADDGASKLRWHKRQSDVDDGGRRKWRFLATVTRALEIGMGPW
jgi:hypothetical protein